MRAEIRVERELEDIRRKMTACIHEMADFMRRVKVTMDDYHTEQVFKQPGETDKARKVLKLVADHYGMTVARMTSRDQQDTVVTARQLSQYIIRQVTTLSYPAIAEVTGITDHSTVMHSMRKIEKLRHEDPEFDAKTRMLFSLAIDEDECPRCEGKKHQGNCPKPQTEAVAQ